MIPSAIRGHPRGQMQKERISCIIKAMCTQLEQIKPDGEVGKKGGKGNRN